MKVILFLCIILFYNINYVTSECTQYQCLDNGESCLKKGTYCPPNSYCEVSFDNPLCTISKKLSDSCTYQGQCADGLICYNSGSDQYCANVKYKGQGESCKKDNECSDLMTCSNKTCTYSGIECKPHTCKAGTFCSEKKTCQNKFADGTICIDDNQCNPNSRCIITSNPKLSKCTPINSLSNGLPCSSKDSCDIGLNLVCFKGYCAEYKDTLETNTTCSNNNQCIGDKEFCICDSVNKPEEGGKCTQTYNIGIDCKNAKTRYFDCLTESGCPLVVSNQYSNETCISKKCDEFRCKYQSNCLNSDYFCGQGGPICSNSSILKNSLIPLLSLLLLLVSL